MADFISPPDGPPVSMREVILAGCMALAELCALPGPVVRLARAANRPDAPDPSPASPRQPRPKPAPAEAPFETEAA